MIKWIKNLIVSNRLRAANNIIEESETGNSYTKEFLIPKISTQIVRRQMT